MNDLQIQYFISAARHLSFSKAAEELFVSQPAVSKQILALERELGCPLFERMNMRIVLTKNGRMFLAFFDKFRTEFFDLKLQAALSLQNNKRNIRLGVLNNWDISHFINDVITEFNSLFPDVNIEINSYEPFECQQALRDGKEDIILTIEPDILTIDWARFEQIGRLQRILLFNTKQKIADRPMNPFDFKDEPFFAVSNGIDISEIIKSVCEPYGFAPMAKPVRSTDSMIMGVQCNMGVAVTDIWCRALGHRNFSYIPLNTSHPLTLMWMYELSDNATETFLNILKSSISNV